MKFAAVRPGAALATFAAYSILSRAQKGVSIETLVKLHRPCGHGHSGGDDVVWSLGALVV